MMILLAGAFCLGHGMMNLAPLFHECRKGCGISVGYKTQFIWLRERSMARLSIRVISRAKGPKIPRICTTQNSEKLLTPKPPENPDSMAAIDGTWSLGVSG